MTEEQRAQERSATIKEANKWRAIMQQNNKPKLEVVR